MRKTPGAPDRRSCPRVPQNVRVLLLTDDCVLEEPYGGLILDSSRGGLRLATHQEYIDEGTVLRIRHARAWDGVPWLPVRVTNRRLINGSWELGCQLLRNQAI